MGQEFVLDPGQLLVCDLEQLGASSLFLPLVEINVDWHSRRREDHRNHVQDKYSAVVLAGEIRGSIERLHRVIVEIHRAKNPAEWICHKSALLRGHACRNHYTSTVVCHRPDLFFSRLATVDSIGSRDDLYPIAALTNFGELTGWVGDCVTL